MSGVKKTQKKTINFSVNDKIQARLTSNYEPKLTSLEGLKCH